MAKNTTTEPSDTPAPDGDTSAEKHVTELMGPPPLINGQDSTVPPEPETSAEPAAPVESEVAKPLEEPLPGAPELSGAPESKVTDIEAINKKLQAQVNGGEGDLDLTELPEDFNATGEAKAPNEKEVQTAVAEDLTGDKEEAPAQPQSYEKPVVMKQSLFARTRNGLLNWWDNPWKRYGTLAVVVALLVFIFGVPTVRNKVLNSVGIRSSVLVQVNDMTTDLPLSKVLLSVDGQQVKTGDDGTAKIKNVHLGPQQVSITKPGFASYTKTVDVGFDLADLGNVALKAVGMQYTYAFVDYISGKPVAGVMLSSGEATAQSDKTGKAILTVPTDAAGSDIMATTDGYRTETFQAPNDHTQVTNVRLVPAMKEIYVSKESGKYDVYKVDLDGTHKEVLLPGTGLESPGMAVSVSPDGAYAAIVSTRDNKRNSDGYLLSALTIVTVKDGAADTLDEHSEQFVLLGWSGTTLLYQQTSSGASAANSARQKIYSLDVSSGKRYQVATANYFGQNFLVGGKLYFTVTGTDPSTTGGLDMVNLDGSNKRTVLTGTVWSTLRTAYDTVLLQTSDNKWHQYKFGDIGTKDTAAPSSYTSRTYVDSPNGKLSAWVDIRDTNGVATAYDIAAAKDTQLATQKYAATVVRWINDHAFIYRVNGPGQTADYAVSVDGGSPLFLTDLSPSQL